MTIQPRTILILAAGQSRRMRSRLSKVLHPVAGRALLAHVLDAAGKLAPSKIMGVVPPAGWEIENAFAPHPTCVQETARGTGDAVRRAMEALPDISGTVLILYADTPLVLPATLEKLCAKVEGGAGLAVMAFEPEHPEGYGRVICDPDGQPSRIVEDKDATAEQKARRLCNAGVMAARVDVLRAALAKLDSKNSNGEFYLTDCVALARQAGHKVALVTSAPEEPLGVNTRADLAHVEAVMQRRLRAQALANGVTLHDPATVIFAYDTHLDADVTVEPYVVFGPGVRVESGARIRAFSHLEGAQVRADAIIGPFARLRPGTHIGAGAHIGNFVELKATQFGAGSKAGHLSYLGDAEVGEGVNIGAGTITCNYDGFVKAKTRLGNGVFVGSNSALVAPVTIGGGAFVAAGSVVTQDVPAEALAVARARQENKPDWARRFRVKRGA